MNGNTTRRIEIGQRIKAAREAKRITQGDLAKRIGIRQNTLSSWERGGVEQRIDNLEAIAAALEITLTKLIGKK